jgi:hypothetical protein
VTSRNLTWIPRLLGLATAGYSVAIIADPSLFAKPTGLQADGAPLPTATAVGVRAIGGRDLASGLAMALAPAGKALRTAIAVRGRRRGVGHAVRAELPRGRGLIGRHLGGPEVVDAGPRGERVQVVDVDDLRAVVEVGVGHHGQRRAVPRLADLDPPVERAPDVEQDRVVVGHGGLLGTGGRAVRRDQGRDRRRPALRLFGGKR